MRRLARLTLVVGSALALSGCVSLLPKGKPVHLYRFGQSSAAEIGAAAATPAAARAGVLHAGGSFQQEASGDRILTLTGDKAAYIAETRWVSPAAVLFDQALARAFEAADGPVRLVARGERTRFDHSLRVDVRNFETRYDDGPGSVPAVMIRVRAVLTANRDRDNPAERLFEARVPAVSNRVASIVAAYDQATGDILRQVVDWTAAETAAAGPTAGRPAASPR